MNCGVYKLLQEATGAYYIGSSKNIKRRMKEHRHDLRRKCHCNKYLQNSFNKYGPLVPSLIIVCSEVDLFLYEQLAIDSLKPQLNLSPIAATGCILARAAQTKEGRERQRQAAFRLHKLGRLGGTSEEMSRRSRLNMDDPEYVEACRNRMIALNANRTPEERSAQAKKAKAAQPADLHVGMKRSPQARENMRQAQLASQARRKQQKEQS